MMERELVLARPPAGHPSPHPVAAPVVVAVQRLPRGRVQQQPAVVAGAIEVEHPGEIERDALAAIDAALKLMFGWPSRLRRPRLRHPSPSMARGLRAAVVVVRPMLSAGSERACRARAG
jgi:hypothetical protein